MGKKKGKKKKGGGKKKDAKQGPTEMQLKEAQSLETELAVGLLEYRLKEAESRYREASKDRDEISTLSIEDKRTHKDMEFFLNKKLDDQYNEIDRLEKKLLRIQSEKDVTAKQTREKADAEIYKIRTELTETTNRLNLCEQELANLKEFRDQRDKLNQVRQEMEKELSESRAKTEGRIVAADKRRVREKQQLEAEFQQRLVEATRRAKEESQAMLHQTTRKAMEENTRMYAELQYQSKAMERLMSTNEELVAENTKLRQELEIQESIKMDFAKKSQMYKTLAETIDKDAGVKDQRAKARVQNLEERDQRLAEEARERETTIDRLRQEIAELRGALENQTRRANQMRTKVRDLKTQRGVVQERRDRLVNLLLAAAEDLPDPSNDDDDARRGAPETDRGTPLSVRGTGRFASSTTTLSYATLSVGGRQKLVEMLLERLGSDRVALLREAEKLATTRRQERSTNLPPLRSPKNTVRRNDVDAKDGLSASTQTDASEMMSLSPMTPDDLTSSIRPWGKRSMGLPHTLHKQDTFLKRGLGAKMGIKGTAGSRSS